MSDCSNWRGDQIKATVEQEFRERRSEDSGARSVRGRQPERMLRVIAETTERVDVFRTRRMRTCLSLSVNKIQQSLHEPTLSASFLTNFVTDLFTSFERFKVTAPGLSRQAFVKMLEHRSRTFGRVRMLQITSYFINELLLTPIS